MLCGIDHATDAGCLNYERWNTLLECMVPANCSLYINTSRVHGECVVYFVYMIWLLIGLIYICGVK